MVYIPTQEEFSEDFQGGAPTTVDLSTGGASFADAGAAQTPAATGAADSQSQPAPTTEGQQPSGQQAAPTPQPEQGGQPQSPVPLLGQGEDLTSRLLSPINQGAQQGQQQAQALGEQFAQQAGPTGQTYESRGGPQAIEKYVEADFGDLGETGAKEQAAGLVGAQYQGPTQLDQTQTQQLQQNAQLLQDRANALTTGGGLQGYLQQATPGVNLGQARFEAQRLRRNQDFADRALQANQAASFNMARLLAEQNQARELGQTRISEEEEIARKAREDLTGRRGSIDEDIQKRVDEANAQRKRSEEAYKRFQETGDVSNLAGLADFDVGEFDTEGAIRAQEAQRIYEKIMSMPEYEAIRDMGPLSLTYNPRGRETYSLGQPELGRGDLLYKRGVEGGPTDEQRDLLESRQRRLEKYFSPGRYNENAREAGAYADVAPMYYAGGDLEAALYSPRDARGYTGFEDASRATRGNQSTEDERGMYNRIADLLNSEQRIQASEDPYREARITADTDRYRSDEERELAARERLLSGEAEDWQKTVKGARKQYRRARDADRLSKPFKEVLGSFGGKDIGNAFAGTATSLQRGQFGDAAQYAASAPGGLAALTGVGGIYGPQIDALLKGTNLIPDMELPQGPGRGPNVAATPFPATSGGLPLEQDPRMSGGLPLEALARALA